MSFKVRDPVDIRAILAIILIGIAGGGFLLFAFRERPKKPAIEFQANYTSQINLLKERISELEGRVSELGAELEEQSKIREEIARIISILEQDRQVLDNLYALINLMYNQSSSVDSKFLEAWVDLETRRLDMDYELITALIDLIEKAGNRTIVVDVDILEQLRNEIRQTQQMLVGNSTTSKP